MNHQHVRRTADQNYRCKILQHIVRRLANEIRTNHQRTRGSYENRVPVRGGIGRETHPEHTARAGPIIRYELLAPGSA